jgi:hypothetical protein
MIQEDCMFHWDTGLELPFNVFMREKNILILGFVIAVSGLRYDISFSSLKRRSQ